MSNDVHNRHIHRLARCLAALCMAGWIACAAPPPSRDVMVLGLGDLPPAVMQVLREPGPDLPHFSRLVQEGAMGQLALDAETASTAALWTTLATGRAQQDHGVGIEADRPATSHGLQVPAVWHRVSAAGRRVAVIGWPGTWPVDDVAGYMVSQHAFFDAAEHGAALGFAVDTELPRTVHPAVFEGPLRDQLATLGPDDDPYVAAAMTLRSSQPTDLLMLYRPVTSAQQADRWLGEILDEVNAATRLMVVVMPRLEAAEVAEVAEVGCIFLLGPGVKNQTALNERPLDGILPTLLTWLGIPDGTNAEEGLPRVGFLRGFPRLPPDDPRTWNDIAQWSLLSGQADQAEAIYRQQLETSPEDAVLHRRLAAALGAQERFDEASLSLDQALSLDPLQPVAYYLRARLSELQGNNRQAYAGYRSALHFDPSLKAAGQGLERLGGSSQPRAPHNPEEEIAAQFVEDALEAGRRGDYDHAIELLDQAENESPSYVLTYQVRSNVYYLKGQIKEAIKALELALMVEPGNALFAENLRRLKAEPPRKPPKAKG